jgi:anti-sigma factor (TIGR02949 family)
VSTGYAIDPCEKCEQMMQPFLDRVLSEQERLEAEEHLEGCEYCRKRYRFEAEFRRFVRLAAAEPMPPELKEKLRALRTPL